MTVAYKTCRLLLLIALVPFYVVPAQADFNLHVRLVTTDPQPGNSLAVDQQLFLKVAYQSDIPLAFRYAAYLHGEKLEAGFYSGHPELQRAGAGEALGWIGFSNVTHIDEVRVEILNAERQKIAEISKPFTFSWKAAAGVTGERVKPNWVKKLERHQDWVRERISDPFEQRKKSFDALLFYLNCASIPFYLLLQGYALWRFHGRWRDLATVPLVSLVPLVLASLVGFGMELSYWVVFIFRGTPFALVYLLAVWLARRRMLKIEREQAGQ
ncbi:hypothetical protein [Geothermobacter hydrogeniphilus]|uniref:hypothetical protein n=1 Tax=Geothermobacter hydrogeniphilus TaxID=1969733 RepID=UPI0011AF628A|nr:hypothetical protein [Geothermobacter hydrogeniphilus]